MPSGCAHIRNRVNPSSKEGMINEEMSKRLFFIFSVSNFQMNSNKIFSKLLEHVPLGGGEFRKIPLYPQVVRSRTRHRCTKTNELFRFGHWLAPVGIKNRRKAFPVSISAQRRSYSQEDFMTQIGGNTVRLWVSYNTVSEHTDVPLFGHHFCVPRSWDK